MKTGMVVGVGCGIWSGNLISPPLTIGTFPNHHVGATLHFSLISQFLDRIRFEISQIYGSIKHGVLDSLKDCRRHCHCCGGACWWRTGIYI